MNFHTSEQYETRPICLSCHSAFFHSLKYHPKKTLTNTTRCTEWKPEKRINCNNILHFAKFIHKKEELILTQMLFPQWKSVGKMNKNFLSKKEKQIHILTIHRNLETYQELEQYIWSIIQHQKETDNSNDYSMQVQLEHIHKKLQEKI